MRFHRFFLGAALAGAFSVPALAQDPAGQSQVVIPLQGQDQNGAPLSGQAVLTALPDGQVKIDQTLQSASGPAVSQSGVASLQGGVLRGQLAPISQEGISQALQAEAASAQAAPIELSVDDQGLVQSQTPVAQAQGSDESHTVRDFFRSLAAKANAAAKDLGARIKAGLAKLKAKAKAAKARAQAAQTAQAAAQAEADQGLPLPESQQLPVSQQHPTQQSE